MRKHLGKAVIMVLAIVAIWGMANAQQQQRGGEAGTYQLVMISAPGDVRGSGALGSMVRMNTATGQMDSLVYRPPDTYTWVRLNIGER